MLTSITYELVGQQKHGLKCELAVAEVEQVFQRGTSALYQTYPRH
jgi:hypothetical protein